jgi:hypothetical protein
VSIVEDVLNKKLQTADKGRPHFGSGGAVTTHCKTKFSYYVGFGRIPMERHKQRIIYSYICGK